MDTHTDDAGGRVNTGPYANRVVIGFACRKDNLPLCSAWNLFNQLCECDTSVSVGSLEGALKYGAFGRRVARSHSSGNVVYVHTGQQVIADDARGAAITSSSTYRYVYADYVDEPILRHTGTTTTLPTTGDNALYYHRNQQYSIVGLTNAAGTLVERYTYSAYGTLGIYAANGTVRTRSTYANRYTYTGREWDPELRLYHFRARWYDPATGGFISRDPLGYVDGMSLYRGYFGARAVDPNGFKMCRCNVTTSVMGSVNPSTQIRTGVADGISCDQECCPGGAGSITFPNGSRNCSGVEPFDGLFEHMINECMKSRTLSNGSQHGGWTENECREFSRNAITNLEKGYAEIFNSGGVAMFGVLQGGNNCDMCLDRMSGAWRCLRIDDPLRLKPKSIVGLLRHNGLEFPYCDPGAHTWQQIDMQVPCGNKSESIPIATIDVYRNPNRPWASGESTNGL